MSIGISIHKPYQILFGTIFAVGDRFLQRHKYA